MSLVIGRVTRDNVHDNDTDAETRDPTSVLRSRRLTQRDTTQPSATPLLYDTPLPLPYGGSTAAHILGTVQRNTEIGKG